jgi:hypothetical protein
MASRSKLARAVTPSLRLALGEGPAVVSFRPVFPWNLSNATLVVIKLDNFMNIQFSTIPAESPHEVIASIEAGARLGDIMMELSRNGRAMSHGTCPTVGIGGHATHGGIGFTCRKWGATTDAIVSMDVVLADGTYIADINEASPPPWGRYFHVRPHFRVSATSEER